VGIAYKPHELQQDLTFEHIAVKSDIERSTAVGLVHWTQVLLALHPTVLLVILRD